MMRSRLSVVCVLGIASLFLAQNGYVGLAAPQQGQTSATAPAAMAPRAVLDRYCVTCHNEKLKTAGLTLDTADPAHVGAHSEVWEKVVRKLRAGDMPPAGSRRPEKATYDALLAFLSTELDRAAAAQPNPGTLPAFQRLTRTEYRNALRDLLALPVLPKEMDIDVLLPADNASSGFDNLRDLLFVSSTQLEQYLSAARKISRLVLGDASIPLIVDTYRTPDEFLQDVQVEGAPFGTRGGTVIRTYLPVDGEYAIQIHLANPANEPHELELSVDGQRVQVFTVDRPQSKKIENAETSLAKTGTRKFEQDLAEQARRLAIAKGYTATVPLKAGPSVIVATFVKHTSALAEQELQPRLRSRGLQPAIQTVTVRGPFKRTGPGDTESRRRIFVCHPASGVEEGPCAKKIFATLARRAYRRPVNDADLRELLLSYEGGHAEAGFEAGIQQGLERLLVSPQFLFRIERDPASAASGTLYRVNDFDLASRLSFFLWSSIPDDELLDVATQGKLKDPLVLERQVRRMLADPRSQTLVTNFAAQWLYLRDMKVKNPNSRLFGDFDKGLQQAFVSETELFLNSVLREEDRSVLDLLTANHTFVNERLAKHYGIPNVYGTDFQRVTLGDDSPRRGLLGQASILTLSSQAIRTSPVLRGKYILDNLLSSPPPPPPPNIPALVENTTEGKPLSMREAMGRHRANPVCASCHARMDPLGFALENFDAVGRWRAVSESGAPIDASASLPDGTAFEGVAGLRQLLVSRPEQFVSGITEKLLTYALGRKTAYYDAPAIRTIMRGAARNNYRFSALVLGIVNSVPFQMRRSGSAAIGSAAAQ
jgi:mono/diheme cytochrome c family protein